MEAEQQWTRLPSKRFFLTLFCNKNKNRLRLVYVKRKVVGEVFCLLSACFFVCTYLWIPLVCCEKSLSRPAHCNNSCVPPRSPPGWARDDDGALDHQGGRDCCVIKQKTIISCRGFYVCEERYIYMWIYVNTCVVCDKYICIYICIPVHICRTFVLWTSIHLYLC